MSKSYRQRYIETIPKSTDEIYKLIEERKESGKETGVAERIYSERTGRTWKEDRDSLKAMEKAFG